MFMARRIGRRIRRYRPRFARRVRRHRSKTIPILPLVGLAAGMAKPVQVAMSGDYMGALAETGARYTGYNFQSGQFDLMYALMNGYLPFVAGCAGHMIAQRLGVNRTISRIPFVGKYISL